MSASAAGTAWNAMMIGFAVTPPTMPMAGLPDDPAARRDALKKLTAAVTRTAEGMAELHKAFASGEPMTREAKQKEIDRVMHDLDNATSTLGAARVARIRAALGLAREAFLAAELPATAAHGEADAGNFLVHGWDEKDKTFRDLGMIDVESMRETLVGGKGAWQQRGTGTAAADIGRFLESLEAMAPGKLTDGERTDLHDAFVDQYFKATPSRAQPVERALDWFRIGAELVAVKNGDASAASRIDRLLGLQGAANE